MQIFTGDNRENREKESLVEVVKNSQRLDRFFTDFFTGRGGVVGFGLTRFDWP
jgi:hypothetical protein